MDSNKQAIDYQESARQEHEASSKVYNNLETFVLVNVGDELDECLGILCDLIFDSNTTKVAWNVHWNIDSD